MSEDRSNPAPRPDLSRFDRVDELCDEFEAQLAAGQRPDLGDFLQLARGWDTSAVFQELLAIEIEHRFKCGEQPDPGEYQSRFPESAVTVERVFAEFAQRQTAPVEGDPNELAETLAVPPEPGESTTMPCSPAPQPLRFGPYRTERVLGRGSFGTVYLAWDEDLSRHVAIKVPHRHLVANLGEAEAFLAEARTAAGLEHPHIVPVYHVGRSDDGRCYVVSKWIDGSSLQDRLRPLPLSDAVEIVATAADALHYAHRRGLVHRDIKPANILLDATDRPYVADFGLAVHEHEQRLRAGEISGTPAYMAPEQVRGEAHRLDGRTDIWALGVVLYELLTGRRPFHGRTADETFDEILHREPRPLRVIDESVPEALERVCLRCLAKRISDRYPVAGDVARELRSALRPLPATEPAVAALTSRHTIENDTAGRVKVGSVVQARYRLDEKTGESDRSTYYLATDLRFDSLVTIWIGQSPLGERTELKERFLSLLRTIATFRSPGFLDHHGYDLLEDGRPVVVMQYVEGTPLDRLERRLTLSEVRDFAAQTGHALQAAHAHGIFHLSFEPSSILLATKNGMPRFVIRHLGLRLVESLGRTYEFMKLREEAASIESFRLFDVAGPALYLAPEQCVGQAQTSAVDIYQYGTMLYELISGRHPFAAYTATAFDLLRAIVEQPPPALPEASAPLQIPESAQELVLKCMAKDPAQRPQTIHDATSRFLAAVESAVTSDSAQLPSENKPAAFPQHAEFACAEESTVESVHHPAELIAMGTTPAQQWSRCLPENQILRLGRAPAGPNGLIVPWDFRISREHADLLWKDGKLLVRLLQSSRNPIYFRGEAVAECEVEVGSEFRISQTLFRVCRAESE